MGYQNRRYRVVNNKLEKVWNGTTEPGWFLTKAEAWAHAGDVAKTKDEAIATLAAAEKLVKAEKAKRAKKAKKKRTGKKRAKKAEAVAETEPEVADTPPEPVTALTNVASAPVPADSVDLAGSDP